MRRFLQQVLPSGLMKVRDSRLPLSQRQAPARGGQGEGGARPRLRPQHTARRAAVLAAARLPGLRRAPVLPQVSARPRGGTPARGWRTLRLDERQYRLGTDCPWARQWPLRPVSPRATLALGPAALRPALRRPARLPAPQHTAPKPAFWACLTRAACPHLARVPRSRSRRAEAIP
jgi:hypothetical protein